MEKTVLFKYVQDSDLEKCLRSKHILISGAAGLVGSSLIDLLMLIDHFFELGITISALGRRKSDLESRFSSHLSSNSKFHIIEGDVSNIAFLDLGVDYIIHAASPAHPLAYAQTPVDVMKANLLGTINMLELAKRSGARLLFISSGEIYGISDDPNSCFKESEYGYIEISNPRSCYPESKRAAETLCASYHAQYAVDTVVARLCHVYGPAITDKNSRADAQFLRNVVQGQDIVMKSPGTQVRSFCYVEDAAMGLLYILLKGTSGEAYNIANKNSVAMIREYAETLALLGGVKIRDEFPSEVEARGYSQVSRAVLSAAKLEMLGWQAQYSLEDGIRDMLAKMGRKD